jgi:hypothetical protein
MSVYHTPQTLISVEGGVEYLEGLFDIFRYAYSVIEEIRTSNTDMAFRTFLTRLDTHNRQPSMTPLGEEFIRGTREAMLYFDHYFTNLGPDDQIYEANFYNIHQNIEENFENILRRLHDFVGGGQPD